MGSAGLPMVRTVMLIATRSLRQHAVSTAITVATTALAVGLMLAVVCINLRRFQHLPVAHWVTTPCSAPGAASCSLCLTRSSTSTRPPATSRGPYIIRLQTTRGWLWRCPTPRATVTVGLGWWARPPPCSKTPDWKTAGTSPYVLGAGSSPGPCRSRCGQLRCPETWFEAWDRFRPVHGISHVEDDTDPPSGHDEDHDDHDDHDEPPGALGVHDESYVVTGVLTPTNAPMDRVIWVPIEGIFRMGGHVLRGTGTTYTAQPGVAIPDAHKEVSAVMLKLHSPLAGFALEQAISRESKNATLAFPIARTMGELFEKLGWASRVLAVIGYAVVLISAGGILASIYNTINERRREIAIFRALGHVSAAFSWSF